MKQTSVAVVLCPACDSPLTPEEDLAVGDCVVCDQCDETLTVLCVDPLELEVDDDELDDEDEDLDELDEDEEDDEIDDEDEDD